MNGNFAAQLTDRPQFSRVETNKVIEMTLKKMRRHPVDAQASREIWMQLKDGKSMQPTEQHCVPVSINILIINLRSTSTLISVLPEFTKRWKWCPTYFSHHWNYLRRSLLSVTVNVNLYKWFSKWKSRVQYSFCEVKGTSSLWHIRENQSKQREHDEHFWPNKKDEVVKFFWHE